MEAVKKPRVLSVTVKDKNVLYAAYMPFLKKGGIFIPTQKDYRLGEQVHLNLHLMDEPEKMELSAHIVWLTPEGAQSVQGIGVEFTEDAIKAKLKIETLLAGLLKSDKTTTTM